MDDQGADAKTGADPTTPVSRPVNEHGGLARLLAWQPLSVECHSPISLEIRGKRCTLAVRPEHEDPTVQRAQGGSLVGIEFAPGAEADLIATTHYGMLLLEDFLSALSVVEGATVQPLQPLHLILPTPLGAQERRFVRFLPMTHGHWSRTVSRGTLETVQRLLQHWDGLESGERLRRAAESYRRAIGSEDALAAFQSAYMGLEALEPLLAKLVGVDPGSETVTGRCAHCGKEWSRKRTLLAGVRAYVHGEVHPSSASAERRADWQTMSALRQKMFHGLEGGLGNQAAEALTLTMHYLHDAICCLSHAHDLESPEYRLARFARTFVLIGTMTVQHLVPLEDDKPLFGSAPVKWVPHARFPLVPEFNFMNVGYGEVGVHFYYLNGDLSVTRERDLEPAHFEGVD